MHVVDTVALFDDEDLPNHSAIFGKLNKEEQKQIENIHSTTFLGYSDIKSDVNSRLSSLDGGNKFVGVRIPGRAIANMSTVRKASAN